MAAEPKAPQDPASDQGYVLIGRIVKAHGIRGEVKVLLFSGSPENFLAYQAVMVVGPQPGQGRTIGIRQARSQGKLAIVQFAGVDTRQAAEALIGLEIWLHERDFPALAAGEYYWFQLTGMRVETEEGRELGSVAGLLNTGAHDLLVVKGSGSEFMIPVRDEFIVSIDPLQRLVIVSHVPGLLEING